MSSVETKTVLPTHKVSHPPPSLLAGTWDLSATEAAPAEESFGLQMGTEAIIGKDSRTLVKPADYGPHGKYRCVVKLQMRFEKQPRSDLRWAMASGWLIRPDIIVTAGHCAYDWGHRAPMGRAIQVKAYIGYHGKGSMHNHDVQFRHVKRIVAPADWLANGKHESTDVAFFQVDKPFVGVKPFQFFNTPVHGSDSIGIVGYPADKRFNNQSTGEQGAQMWQAFSKVNWDLSKSKMHTLDYTISTYPGQSGSPVIKKGTLSVIGVHVYGGESVNSASAIGGRYGNDFKAYLNVFDKKHATVRTTNHIRYVKLSMQKTEADENDIEAGDQDGPVEYGSENYPVPPNAEGGENALPEAGTEAWFGAVLRTVAPIAWSLASRLIQHKKKGNEGSLKDDVSPFAGVIGGHMSAIAGGILATGTAASSAESSESTQPDPLFNFQRSLLAESALQAILNMDVNSVKSSGLYANMQKTYTEASFKIPQLVPELVPLVVEAGLRLASYYANKGHHENATGEESQESTEKMELPNANLVESFELADPEAAAFVEGMLGPTQRVSTTEAAEGGTEFWFLIPWVIRGAMAAAKVAQFVHKRRENASGDENDYGYGEDAQGEDAQGEDAQGEDAQGEGGQGEAVEGQEDIGQPLENALAQPETAGIPPINVHVQNLCRRALMGEAALQALIKQSTKKEAKNATFFDDIKRVMQLIGGPVLHLAPGLAKSISPIVQGRKEQGDEAENAEATTAPEAGMEDVTEDAAEATSNKGMTFGQSLTGGNAETSDNSEGWFWRPRPVWNPYRRGWYYESGLEKHRNPAPQSNGITTTKKLGNPATQTSGTTKTNGTIRNKGTTATITNTKGQRIHINETVAINLDLPAWSKP